MRGTGTRWAAAAVALAVTLGVPAVASASPGHHHGTTTSQTTATKAYWAQVAVIDHQFVVAVNQAKAARAAALAVAKNAGQRSAARAQYALAIDEAVQVREQALIALGPPPSTTSTARVAMALGPRVGV